MNLGVSTLILVFGLPGFEAMPAVGWMLGLLFVFHVAQNLRWRASRRTEKSSKHSEAHELRASVIRDALADEE